MPIFLTIVCILLGLAVYFAGEQLLNAFTNRLSHQQRQHSYYVAKNFPHLVFTTIFCLAFFSALGATVVYYLASPFTNSWLRKATEWGPEFAGGMLALLLLGFWSSPDAPSEPPPPRGRSLTRPIHKLRTRTKPPLKPAPAPRLKPAPQRLSPLRRGRTIRTFRDE